MASVVCTNQAEVSTQSSFLLVGPSMHAGYEPDHQPDARPPAVPIFTVQSGYFRRNLVLRGKRNLLQVAALADIERINRIGGYYAFSKS